MAPALNHGNMVAVTLLGPELVLGGFPCFFADQVLTSIANLFLYRGCNLTTFKGVWQAPARAPWLLPPSSTLNLSLQGGKHKETTKCYKDLFCANGWLGLGFISEVSQIDQSVAKCSPTLRRFWCSPWSKPRRWIQKLVILRA